MSIQRHGTTPRYSDSTVHAGTVYLVEVPPNPQADIRTQTRELLENVEHLLTQAGSDKGHMLLVTIYLRTMDDYAAMNEIWDNWLLPETAPARACVGARLAHPDYKVEMVVIAAQKP